jgi:hypothetical protein
VTGGAARPAAGRWGALASHPGPQASTRDSARPVKSARSGAGADLAPGPEPRAGTCRCPPRQDEGTGRALAGYREGGSVARAARAHATVAPALAAGQPGEGIPGCGQRVMLLEGSVMAG